MDLTIIIPTRNRNTNVAECIEALEHNHAEIIVVDDASIRPVVLSSDSVRVLRHDRRRSRGACINTGLKAAKHDLVLIIDDDVFAAPDMVMRLVEEFSARKNPKLGLSAHVTWDPDVPLTLTMSWMETVHKFPSPILLSRSFILENGGYDENFTRRLEDIELQLRLKEGGFELCRLESAVGFQHNMLKVRDLVQREFMEGLSAVFLHAKFPQFMPQVDEIEVLLKNEGQAAEAAAAVEEIALLEQSGPSELPSGIPDLFTHVCRHYFLHGIFEGLKDIGGMKPRRNTSSTIAIYRHASYLENIGEFDEARRLFSLVLHRRDEQFWDGAEYHLGRIEITMGNPERAHAHFLECLRLNPTHNEARRALYKPAHYRELEVNVFERIEPAARRKVLFVLFGDLEHVVNSVPVVAALKNKFNCETAWLTSPEYGGLARGSVIDEVHETKSSGLIPWDWIHEQDFTHVFFPEPEANFEEWQHSGLHSTDFIAKKCGVEIQTRRARIKPNAAAVSEAEEFLREHGIKKNAFVTASMDDGEGRHWPNSNLTKLAQYTDLPIIVFRRKGDAEISGVVGCLDKPVDVIAVLIGWSCFYLGPASGTSWLATVTDTPMGVFFDPQEHRQTSKPFRDSLRGEKSDIKEWSIFTNLRTVLDHVESTVLLPQ